MSALKTQIQGLKRLDSKHFGEESPVFNVYLPIEDAH